MSLLLDTHVWLWAVEDPAKLGKATRTLLTHPDQQLFVSAVSVLELARLVALAQVELSGSVGAWVERSIYALGAQLSPLDHHVAMEAYALPGQFHSDPADRIVVATARHHGWRVVTADARILGYRQVRSVDARK